MTSLSKNPAVLKPAATLTRIQRDALIAIDFFRYHSRDRRGWQIGNRHYAPATVSALEKHGLVIRRQNSITTTVAGKLALDKLKGKSS
ncbi:hypothetical protein J5N58_01385 [Rhizobium cremeum]|uniref:hypothetical protein n=1 Tax=Rhizobium cremeum TaxID=2813827 RepID=UPI001FD4E4EE|nr:hypothetical protein [Rhizobium cremeum]MCJ7993250.1 hypothetical protein [Rhizobium cremeum]MCJ7998315.1 hypothetical protein [Rhizobium cremeum]